MTPFFTYRLTMPGLCLLLGSAAHAGGNGALLGPTPSKRFAQTQAADAFGWGLDLDGNTAVVTAHRHYTSGSELRGVAHVYEHSGSGWSQPTTIQAGNPAVPSNFATSVAISGDRMVLGAFNDFSGGGPGRADVFERINGSWVLKAELTTPNASTGFGTSVAIDGNYIIVGDPSAEAATIFQRHAGSWSQLQQLQALPIIEWTKFGSAVAIEGDLIAVGRAYFPTFESRKGAIHIYRRIGASWSPESQFLLQDGGNYPEMGENLAIDNGRILTGAWLYTLSDYSNSPKIGAAFILEKVGDAWTSTRLLSSSPTSLNFGDGVALQGDVAIIGAPGEDGSGRIYSFVRSGPGAWGEIQRMGLPGLPANAQFGASLAISGQHVLASAPGALPAAAHVLDLSSVEGAGINFSVAAPRARACPAFPRLTTVSWSSEAVSCRALPGSLSSWADASCAHPTASCPDPRDFQLLEPAGSVLVTTVFAGSPGAADEIMTIECTNATGRPSRATISLTTYYDGMDSCPTPTHSLASALSQGPTALANGTFEMRATVNNPAGRTLAAIARQPGQYGSAHARIEGNQLIMLFAPAASSANTVISSSISVAVADGEVAVEGSYPFSIDLGLFASGFE